MKILGVETGDSGRRAAASPASWAACCERNAELRDVFAADPAAAARLAELQQWQSERLLRSHADLRANPRYRQAVEFFFNELYNGGDPRGRDRDVMRVQRVMEKLLPREALAALCLAIELEVLSQELDADVVRGLPAGPISVETLRRGLSPGGPTPGSRATDRAARRHRQLPGSTWSAKPIIRRLVRFARGPAHAAGFGTLQEFLERGLDAFETMHGADEFLATIRDRELRAMERVFAGAADPFEFGDRNRRGKAG